jgi:predicted ATPase
VRETYLPVTRHGAFFFSGKFDLTMRREPFAAWVQIFDKIVDHILAEPDESLAAWRANISTALGAHAVLLTGRSRLAIGRGPQARLTKRHVQTSVRDCRSS